MRRLPVIVLLVLWSSTELAARTYDNLDQAVGALTELLVLRAQVNGVKLKEESIYITPCDFRERGGGPFSGLSKRLAGLFSEALRRQGVSVVAVRGEGEEMFLRAEWTVETEKLLLEPRVLRAIPIRKDPDRKDPELVAGESGRVPRSSIDRSHFEKDPTSSCDEVIVIDPDKEAAEREAALKLTSAEQKEVKRGLLSLGWDVGPMDGLLDGSTREALRKWQSKRRVKETGYLTKQQAEVLIELGLKARLEECAGQVEAGRLSEARGCYEGLEADAPGDERVREGLARVKKLVARANEALAGAEEALNQGELWKAKGHVEELRRLAGGHPRLGELEARIKEFKERYLPGKRFRDCDECPELVVVPAGTFDMGSPGSEAGRSDSEGPAHRVRIERRFAVGVYEVTRGEYSRFVSATGHSSGDSCGTYEGGEWEERRIRDWRRPGYEQTDAHPVVCLSWEDAKAYVGWLSKETGEEYRLLSESEWEYVARGGAETARYWGESESEQCSYANGADAGTDLPWRTGCDDGYVRTSPVGSFGGNGFGLHDVLGNVWEWVEDCWNDDYRGAPADGGAWKTGNCSRRVVRGLSWHDNPRDLRSAYRGRNVTGFRYSNHGFRIARTLTP